MAIISRLSKSFFSIKWRFVVIYLLVVAMAFAAVAIVVVKMADDFLVTQRINETFSEVNNVAVQMASRMQDTDSDGMYALAVQSSKRTGGRYLVLDTSGVVQTDSYSSLNGQRFTYDEIKDILSGTKTMSYGFHQIEDKSSPNGYFWAAYYTFAIVDDSKLLGVLLFSEKIEDVVEQTQRLALGIALISICACLVVIFISLLLSGYITKPILKLRDVTQQIADGHFEQRVRVSGKNEIAELGDAFNKMSERLENLDIQRSEFVSNASHELKTPLSSIKILVESILYQDSVDTAIVKEFLGDINMEIDRLNNIISDLLAITKLDGQPQPLHSETVSLKKLLEKTASGLEPLANKKDIEMNLDIEADIVTVCDPLKIRQAIANLIDNALKYTNNGGRVTVRLTRSAGFARIDVEDTGQGIAEEYLPHIFERFYRVDKARSRETGGTGLGLYITKRIADLHGGMLTVESKEGEGSVFTLYLPAAKIEEQVVQ